MAIFPAEDDKVLTLGQEMSSGLKANKKIFPNPPVDPKELDAGEKECIETREAAVAAQAAAEQATAAKQAAFQKQADRIKKNLRYAENTTDFSDLDLKLIGWSGRRTRTPVASPGRALNLAIVEQGKGRIKLHWGKPIDGGKVMAYQIVCRERTEDNWDSKGTAVTTEIALTGQEQGKELEYGVVTINKAGEGPISNTVTAVL
uniref:Fibronectin type-III domain-containing protein n=1 Tax=Candidatus Kentrum sp. DK TaxID=2126562 RepID=A0A450SD38_9GAMM|nr:MAG: hypothetical protein BECKDK2373B_GA0170837_102819 [Candidatus Kentron sp. DK]